MSGRIETRNRSGDLAIDHVLSTQSELGPTIPDGGYGWIVFLVTLFYQVGTFAPFNVHKTIVYLLAAPNP